MSRAMSLWELERLRLLRTRRWLVLAGAYAFSAVVGPLTARYLGEIVERFGGGVEVEIPDPVPLDGIIQYGGNASQFGLIAVIVVAAGALALDARPEVGVYLRTRVAHARILLWPRVVVASLAAVVAFVAGTAVAWALTAALLGAVDVGGMVLGTALGALYLVVVVAVVAALGTVTRSVVATVFASLAVVILLPILGLLPVVGDWVPSELVGALTTLAAGGPAAGLWRPAVTSVLAIAALLALAARRAEAREL